MAEVSAEELFRLADEAAVERDRSTGDDVFSDGADAGALFENPTRNIFTGKPTFSLDVNGDVHVCFGPQCQYASLDREKNWICCATGRVVGQECSREQDPSWTGRSTGSANPDDSAGTPVGGWLKRRDMYQASVAAYRGAHAISDAEIAPPPPPPKPSGVASTPAAKRGALCVDEEATEQLGKRPRSSRKENWTRDCIQKLANEAIGVIDKLFIVNLDGHATKRATAATATTATATTATAAQPLDPRMQNIDFVRPLALKSYVTACEKGRQALNLVTLTSVVIHVNEFVRNQRALAAEQREATTKANPPARRNRACFSGQVRNLLAQLIVSLWRASCLTNHFKQAKRGNDSFRPFVAGILYSLKRGLYLADGTCIVPVLEELSNHLPALRSSSSTAAAKQLQSSSHRGICSIQRSLASLHEMSDDEAAPALTFLKDAARQGAFLREMVSRSAC